MSKHGKRMQPFPASSSGGLEGGVRKLPERSATLDDSAPDDDVEDEREMMNASPTAADIRDRRDGPDRRRIHPLLADWKWAFKGRRRATRRGGEESWPDVYDPRTVLTVFLIIALSALDATFTLRLLSTGVVHEANPFMRFLIEHDVQVFVNLKTALTAGGLLFMVVASNARIGPVRVRTLLHGVLALYIALIGYELTLLWRVGALG